MEGFQDRGFRCVILFSKKHSCFTIGINSLAATIKIKPDSPYQPACLDSGTSGLWNLECASVHNIGIVVLNQSANCVIKFKRNIYSKVTWSLWSTLTIFQFNTTPFVYCEIFAIMKSSTCNCSAYQRLKTREQALPHSRQKLDRYWCDEINLCPDWVSTDA